MVLYEFVAANCSLPEASAMYAWLDKMQTDLRRQGYSPVTEDALIDLNEEDKETWLSRHSEKLALAFAILRTAPKSTIRTVKNLRKCCLSFICEACI